MRAACRDAGRLGSLLALALLMCGVSKGRQPGADDKWADRFPNVALRTQDNKEVRFYDDLIKNKIAIVNFMYTGCEECKRGMRNLAQVQKALLADELGRKVSIYSITIRPETDTPKVLKAYAQSYEAKSGWTFLTGKPDDITAVRRALGLSNLDPELQRRLGLAGARAEKAADETQHMRMIAIVYDARHQKVKRRILSTPDEILGLIKRMTPRSAP